MYICKKEYSGICKDCLGKKGPDYTCRDREEMEIPEIPPALQNNNNHGLELTLILQNNKVFK
jgi:hypothetical protein